MIKERLTELRKYLNLKIIIISLSVSIVISAVFLIWHFVKLYRLNTVYQEAISAYSVKNLDKSKSLLLQIYESNSDFKNVSFLLGKIEYFSKNFDQSTDYFKNCADNGKLNCKLWILKSLIHSGKDYDLSEKVLNQLAEEGFENPELDQFRGILYERKGKLDLALESYNRSISYTSAILPSLARMEAIYKKAGFQDKAERYKEFSIAIQELNRSSKMNKKEK
ncbi:tetratricopeptide repeat protein [Leptospira koniambonensis]|uniref:tetratricopeptide repeat protein n=1 Tax=Leptospira koniambonensis TaxID=2484950 RepID=UPI003EC0A834